jgi:ankyrin repeat protein
MDVFDDLAAGKLDDLNASLLGDPSLALSRHASGASLLAWAYYVGKPEALPMIRPHMGPLDPYDAIIDGDADALKTALDGGWDGNALSADGFTPLGLAAFFNRPAIFDLLLPVTRDLDEPAQNGQRVAAIHAAAAARSTPMIEKLLKAGADPNLRQHKGFTAIHAAAEHGDATMAGVLLLFGADPRLATDDGDNAADIARKAGHDWLATRLEAAGGTRSR